MAKKIVIVGAGPGGLTAGMILAHRGFDVHIYEKADRVGGRNAELRVGDHAFDTGPTFLMMKFLLDDIFTEVGRNSGDYMKFTILDPMYRLHFNDKILDITQDREKMKAQIAQHFPGNEEGYDRFMKKEQKRFKHIVACLEKDYSSIGDFFSPIFLRAIPHIPFGKSLIEYLGNYFEPEELRTAFTFQAKYLGMSPWNCPAFFVIMPFIEHKFGIYHVEGGLSRISDVMSDIIDEEGGKIHLNTGVKQVLLKGKKAIGIELENGDKVLADEVVMNADFAYAMNSLIPKGILKKYSPEKLAKRDYSCSTFMLYIGLDKVYEDIPHHNIIFASDYKENLKDISERRVLSDDTSIYVRNSVVTDATTSPAGKSGFYVLVPVSNNKAGIDWAAEKIRYRNNVISIIAKRLGIEDFEDHIEAETIITPDDWEGNNVYLGAVFNLAHTLNQMLYFRPHNKFEELDNMYLVGGGTHPGSGLPTIYESGRISANMISKVYGIEYHKPTPDAHQDKL
ncbi:MAG: phytoene desaturase family protein [Patescibacteria group bacterium]